MASQARPGEDTTRSTQQQATEPTPKRPRTTQQPPESPAPAPAPTATSSTGTPPSHSRVVVKTEGGLCIHEHADDNEHHHHDDDAGAGAGAGTRWCGCAACVLSRKYNNAMVSSVVKGAFVYLDRLAVDAQKSANEANVEVDDTLSKIRAEMLAMVDAKIGKLKAEIQSNLETSFNKLKSLNSNDYTGKQRLLCSRERLMKVLRTSLEEISIFKGTHILDLPVAVLSRIICYLPRKSILAARATCLQLWDAVACGCRDSPISTEAHKGSHPILGEAWMFTGKDTFSTPCMTFQVSVVKIPTGGIGVYFRVIKRKLYAQAKKVIVQLHPCAFNNQQQQQQQQQPQQPLKPQACFLETYQLAKSAKWGVEFPDEVTRVQISITMLEGTSVVPKGPSPTFRHRPRLNA